MFSSQILLNNIKSVETSDGRIDLADEISILDDMLGIYGDDED